MKRGDVVICVVSGDYGKPRPALIVQSDLYNPTHASLAILPITTHRLDTPLFRIDLQPGKLNGLTEPSQVMVDKITAVRRDRIRGRIGRVSPALMGRIEEALRGFLGLRDDDIS
jgi:mRNA interferase MazF